MDDTSLRPSSETFTSHSLQIIASYSSSSAIISIILFNQLVFDIPQLLQFIAHTGITKSYNRATVIFHGTYVRFSHCPPEGTNSSRPLILGVLGGGIDRQVSCMAQICSQYSSFLPSVEQLDIRKDYCWSNSDQTPWLELFRPFTAVRTLRISRDPQPSIAHTLQELTGERAIEVLPELDGLYLEDYQPSGPEQKAIEPFIAARQYSDHPVAVHHWDRSGTGWLKRE